MDVTEQAPARSRRGGARLFRDILIILAVALLASFLIKTFLVRSFFIPSGSMENTLMVDDRILVNQLAPDLVPLANGDVVVFEDPGGWLPTAEVETNPLETVLSAVGLAASDPNNHLIKRVIGLPGDVVACCDPFGHLTVNGVPLEEPYIALPTENSASAPATFEVTVPDGMIWVMGDNRYNSKDSVFHRDEPAGGFVPVADVVGTAFVITWPTNRWSFLGNYPFVFREAVGNAD
ncbi:signal peptidase I [Conyzicola nivalis]|uniref:Signal peptidase I n=1 Tax=Conyzicola nivalis TaxID=1477021 RepID=A0A916WJP4_9MICO|nr:signal peptidase I [Conyzicola nivalis]GGB06336.1 signal peptidase I [Conyzicola nivalis]